ncbi:hypothetical protein [Agromyces sp. H66]|uniref:hypothetical protein n=1 Tax=Agromyces sp. H66 TaxID=2529859 RepID=UPI00145A9851|nr:hypothetical protein [Agromyces sp. H66]
MSEERVEQYRRMLRWYPSQWRAEHEAVVVGILLDQADARGEPSPRIGDRFALAVGGLRRGFGVADGRRPAVIIPLVLAAAFLTFYVSVITWSPGVDYAGTLGPFSNPTVIVAGLFVVALAAAFAGRNVAARWIAVVAAGTQLGLSLLASGFDWLGPSLPTAVLVAGLGVISALPWHAPLATGISLSLLLSLFAFILAGDIAAAAVPLPGVDLAVAVAQTMVLAAVIIVIARAARRATTLELRTGAS